MRIFSKPGIQGNAFNMIKDTYEKSAANISLNDETLKTFSLNSGTRVDNHFHHFYSTLYRKF